MQRMCALVLWALGFYGLAVMCPACPILFVPLTVIWMTFAGRIISALLVEKVMGPGRVPRSG